MAGIKTLLAIVDGFKNYHFPTKEMEMKAKNRATVCASCEHADHDYTFKQMLDDGRTKEIKGLGCSICGCLLSAKVRQDVMACPHEKWK